MVCVGGYLMGKRWCYDLVFVMARTPGEQEGILEVSMRSYLTLVAEQERVVLGWIF